MRITFLCQYFPPEMGAPAARTWEHARHWVADGHQVTVITGFPNHPTGVIRPEYRGKLMQRENVAGIDLLRTWVYVTPNKGFTKRILNFLSYFVSSLLLGTLFTARPDVIVGTSPQFFCAVAGYFLSCLKGVPFIFEVRDIWPQSAIELKVLRNPLLIAALEWIELFLYRRAALIVAVAESTRDYLIEKGIAPEKISIVPNGIDAEYLATPSLERAAVREQLGVPDKFLVSYIGTHGLSHALETVLYAAAQLETDARFHFLLVGEGAEKAKLQALATELQLTNVTFLAQQPRETLLGFYRASDVCLVPLKRLGVFTKVLPSKMFEMMGNACPIICGVEGEAARLIERAQSGLCVEPENVSALVRAIQRLQVDGALRRQLGQNGQAFVLANYSRAQLARRYLGALNKVVQRPQEALRPETAGVIAERAESPSVK